MSRKALLVLLLFLLAVLFGGYTIISSYFGKQVSGLKVLTSHPASVFLNDKLVGKTPYEAKHPAGEYTVKLIPDESADTLSSWQGRVKLSPSLLTYIKRDFGPSELTSAGEILTLERISGSENQLVVLSSPDAATVIFDGQVKGTTPVTLRDVVSGEHDVALTSAGFTDRTVRVQATPGYKLTVSFQLSLLSPQPSSATPSATDGTPPVSSGKPQVLIKDTPTGFLRVRTEPSTSASESGRVQPGEKFPFLDERSGWFQIEYEAGKSGWISGRYAQKTE